MTKTESKNQTISYGAYVLVWLGLLVMTGLTITVSGAHLGSLSILSAILIASFKTFLVLFFFMHLKYESNFIRLIILIIIAILTIFIALTFVDVSFR